MNNEIVKLRIKEEEGTPLPITEDDIEEELDYCNDDDEVVDEVVDELDKMIDDHWKYVSLLSEMMYKTAFEHGYKHGKEDKEKNE